MTKPNAIKITNATKREVAREIKHWIDNHVTKAVDIFYDTYTSSFFITRTVESLQIQRVSGIGMAVIDRESKEGVLHYASFFHDPVDGKVTLKKIEDVVFNRTKHEREDIKWHTRHMVKVWAIHNPAESNRPDLCFGYREHAEAKLKAVQAGSSPRI